MKRTCTTKIAQVNFTPSPIKPMRGVPQKIPFQFEEANPNSTETAEQVIPFDNALHSVFYRAILNRKTNFSIAKNYLQTEGTVNFKRFYFFASHQNHVQ